MKEKTNKYKIIRVKYQERNSVYNKTRKDLPLMEISSFI